MQGAGGLGGGGMPGLSCNGGMPGLGGGGTMASMSIMPSNPGTGTGPTSFGMSGGGMGFGQFQTTGQGFGSQIAAPANQPSAPYVTQAPGLGWVQAPAAAAAGAVSGDGMEQLRALSYQVDKAKDSLAQLDQQLKHSHASLSPLGSGGGGSGGWQPGSSSAIGMDATLPTGWSRHWDVGRQAYFYYNSMANPPITQWEPPTPALAPAPPYQAPVPPPASPPTTAPPPPLAPAPGGVGGFFQRLFGTQPDAYTSTTQINLPAPPRTSTAPYQVPFGHTAGGANLPGASWYSQVPFHSTPLPSCVCQPLLTPSHVSPRRAPVDQMGPGRAKPP